jgi:hypothetical protein
MDFFSCIRDTLIYFGINSQITENEIQYQISPNPFSDYLQIETRNHTSPIILYNSIGVQMNLLQMNESSELKILDTSMLKPGMYFIQIGGSSPLIKLIKI